MNSYNIAYIGDDVNDIDLLKLVGFSACPQGGIKQVKKNVDYVCQQYGGNGAFREIADLILHTQFPNQKKMYWSLEVYNQFNDYSTTLFS